MIESVEWLDALVENLQLILETLDYNVMNWRVSAEEMAEAKTRFGVGDV